MSCTLDLRAFSELFALNSASYLPSLLQLLSCLGLSLSSARLDLAHATRTDARCSRTGMYCMQLFVGFCSSCNELLYSPWWFAAASTLSPVPRHTWCRRSCVNSPLRLLLSSSSSGLALLLVASYRLLPSALRACCRSSPFSILLCTLHQFIPTL